MKQTLFSEAYRYLSKGSTHEVDDRGIRIEGRTERQLLKHLKDRLVDNYSSTGDWRSYHVRRITQKGAPLLAMRIAYTDLEIELCERDKTINELEDKIKDLRQEMAEQESATLWDKYRKEISEYETDSTAREYECFVFLINSGEITEKNIKEYIG